MGREHVLYLEVRVTDESYEMDVLHGIMRGENRAQIVQLIEGAIPREVTVGDGPDWVATLEVGYSVWDDENE